jgi:hypothetical protein
MAEMNRTWAVVRIVLGIVQVMGATVALVFLLQTGASGLTIAATDVTLCFTCLSRLLF